MTRKPEQQQQLPTDTPVRELLPVRVTCRRCHRPLHDPLSRMLRLGPECREGDDPAQRYDVDQDALPGM